MPCWTITTIELDLTKTKDSILESAVEELGWSMSNGAIRGRGFTARRVGGALEVMITGSTTAEAIQKKLKRQITAEVVKAGARRFRWGCQQTTQNTLTLRPR